MLRFFFIVFSPTDVAALKMSLLFSDLKVLKIIRSQKFFSEKSIVSCSFPLISMESEM